MEAIMSPSRTVLPFLLGVLLSSCVTQVVPTDASGDPIDSALARTLAQVFVEGCSAAEVPGWEHGTLGGPRLYVAADGTPVEWEFPVLGEDGRPRGFVTVGVDPTFPWVTAWWPEGGAPADLLIADAEAATGLDVDPDLVTWVSAGRYHRGIEFIRPDGSVARAPRILELGWEDTFSLTEPGTVQDPGPGFAGHHPTAPRAPRPYRPGWRPYPNWERHISR